MEGGSLVAESLLAGAQGTEILGSLRINIKIKSNDRYLRRLKIWPL